MKDPLVERKLMKLLKVVRTAKLLRCAHKFCNYLLSVTTSVNFAVLSLAAAVSTGSDPQSPCHPKICSNPVSDSEGSGSSTNGKQYASHIDGKKVNVTLMSGRSFKVNLLLLSAQHF